MIQKKDWKKPFALILLIVVLGGYYEQLGVEARTMVLPLAIFIAAGIVISRLKKLEYEMTSSRVTAQKAVVQTFSVIDAKRKRMCFHFSIPRFRANDILRCGICSPCDSGAIARTTGSETGGKQGKCRDCV